MQPRRATVLPAARAPCYGAITMGESAKSRALIALAVLVGAVLVVYGRPPEVTVPGRTVITYWEKWTGFEGDAMRATVDAFNQSQDEIFVKMLTVSQVDRKMLLATAGNDPPDVAGLWSGNVNVYADKGALLCLDDYCAEAGIGPEDYIPCYWELVQHRGHTWALPSTPASIALHWNKRLFREAGLDPDRPPKTIEELDEYAAKLTKYNDDGSIKQLGFIPAEPGWWNWGWGYFFGGRLWDGGSRITCASAENIRAYTWVRTYAEKYRVKQLQTFQSGFGNFSSPQNPFLSGVVAMELQGVWMHNFIDMYAPDLEWGAAPFPYPADRPDLANTTIVEEDVLVIPASARHPKEAFEFLKFVNSQPGMEQLCMGQRKLSPLAEQSEAFLRDHPHPYLSVFTDLAKSENAMVPPSFSLTQEYQSELTAAFDDIWLMRASPEEALTKVQERMQAKLDTEIARWARRGKSYVYQGEGGP
jgi:multiple sugar transport system substrate-binding protein